MREFMTRAKEKGWSPFLYGDSLCWVTWQGNTGYDGMPYFRSHGGEAAVARRPDGYFGGRCVAVAEELLGLRRNREGTPDDSGDDAKDGGTRAQCRAAV